MKARDVIKYTLSIVLAVVLVYFAFRNVDWTSFWGGLGQTRWIWALAFLVASIVALWLRSERWLLLLKPFDPQCRRITVWDANNIGNLANQVISGAGEVVRSTYVASSRAGLDKVMGTAVCERAFDLLAVLVLFALSLVFGWEKFGGFFSENVWGPLAGRFNIVIWISLGTLVLLGLAALWAVFHWENSNKLCAKTARIIRGLIEGFVVVGRMDKKWLFALYTVAIWFVYVVMSWTMFKALPPLAGLGLGDALFVSAMGNFASVIPVPGGFGAYHYLVALSMQALYGATWDMGILYATLNHELHAIIVIVLGIVSWIAAATRKRQA